MVTGFYNKPMSAPLNAAPPVASSFLFHGQPAWQMALPGGDRVVVAAQGAQVLSWTTADGTERLFLSPRSVFDGHTAIRGGVPVCFPQFNQRGPLPKHGFARNLPWQLSGSGEAADGQGRFLRLSLADSEATRRWWPDQSFAAELAVTLRPGALRVELSAHNPGTTAWDFTAALHTYLRVDDIATVRLDGLDGCARWDAVADVHGVQHGPVSFEGEYDSVFAAAPAPLQVQPAAGGRLSIAQGAEWDNTVVWNPGATRCAALADMPADGYRHMLCVEAACIDRPVAMAPGARWSGWQQLQVL
ncbi:glucose-6-phosphate 1-epimerase [Paracidovorax wautersii]|uniref:Putative glucose-6-phosphate 1-epimerase n=2 Tax=Paracidovorax wautersii TaxID=1177982 RepID=A0A1I2G0Y8_9BURK|nr:glucose-6-phosphate 1-epimerase [Paracidovorax wautersii]